MVINLPPEYWCEAGEVKETPKVDHLLPPCHGAPASRARYRNAPAESSPACCSSTSTDSELTISFLFPHSYVSSLYCSSPHHSSFPSSPPPLLLIHRVSSTLPPPLSMSCLLSHLICPFSTFPLHHHSSLPVPPAIGFLSPLVSRGERQ